MLICLPLLVALLNFIDNIIFLLGIVCQYPSHSFNCAIRYCLFSLHACFPDCLCLVYWYVCEKFVFGTHALADWVVHIVATTEAVEEVVKCLCLVAKWLGLAMLAVLLSLLYLLMLFLFGRRLVFVFTTLVVRYIRSGSKIWLPPLVVGVVVLAFFLHLFLSCKAWLSLHFHCHVWSHCWVSVWIHCSCGGGWKEMVVVIIITWNVGVSRVK